MKRRIISIVICLCMMLPLIGELAPSARAYEISDWIPEIGVPAGAEIVERKWCYSGLPMWSPGSRL